MNEFIEIAKRMTYIRSFDDFWAWYTSLPIGFMVLFTAGAIGLVAILYIFIKAIFVDKEN